MFWGELNYIFLQTRGLSTTDIQQDTLEMRWQASKKGLFGVGEHQGVP